MGCLVETAGQILHDRRDAASPPSLGEDEIPKQETQGVADVKPGCGDPRSIGNAGRPGKGPGAEAGHEAAQSSDQPGHTTSASKVFRGTSVEAHHVQADHHHQQGVQPDHNVVHGVDGGHRKVAWFLILRSKAKEKPIDTKRKKK